MINNDENNFFKEFSELKNEYFEWGRKKNKYSLYKLDKIQNNLYLLEGNITEFIGKKYKNKKDDNIYIKNLESLLHRIQNLQNNIDNQQQDKNISSCLTYYFYYFLMIIILRILFYFLNLSDPYNLITPYIIFAPLFFFIIHNLDKIKSVSSKKLKSRKYKHWRK